MMLLSTANKKMRGDNMQNTDIRHAISAAGLKHWEVADALGISEATLTRWLRRDLPEEKRGDILATIKHLKEARNDG